jgi:hypothetical protein
LPAVATGRSTAGGGRTLALDRHDSPGHGAGDAADALDSDNPGREIMGSMATIIVSGLLASALLNLLVRPAMTWRYGRFVTAD